MNGKTLPLIALALAVGAPAGPTLAKAVKAHGKSAAHKTAKAPKRHPAGGSTPDSAAWKSDPSLLSKLDDPPRVFGAYSMRVPTGFTVDESDVPATGGKITQFMMKGPGRPDGSFPILRLVVAIADEEHVTRSTDGLLKRFGASLDGEAGLTRADIEDGECGELEMSRQYFKFHPDGDERFWAHGVIYATTDGHNEARFEALDVEPYHTATLALLESAILTLRKTN